MNKAAGRRRFWKFQGPAIGLALAIFIASSFAIPPVPRFDIRWEDKWEHLLAYGVFGYLLMRAYYYQDRFPALRRRVVLWGLISGILYGISDEIHQYFVPGRYADVYDALADAVGVGLGCLLFYYRHLREDKPPA